MWQYVLALLLSNFGEKTPGRGVLESPIPFPLPPTTPEDFWLTECLKCPHSAQLYEDCFEVFRWLHRNIMGFMQDGSPAHFRIDGLGSNPGEDMDVRKRIEPSRRGGTLNSHRAASSVEREERWETHVHPHAVLAQNWSRTEEIRAVTSVVLKAKITTGVKI
ncbi:hypothetical protein TNCV_1845921 [Trichonephila clavipes]|nr:hypothetical protein TNCV_1845921 [Trichonephila clavipes]